MRRKSCVLFGVMFVGFLSISFWSEPAAEAKPQVHVSAPRSSSDSAAGQEGWRSIRGNDGTGKINPGGILASGKKIGLKVRWRYPIGSGYSSVAISDGKAVTMYSGSDGDYAICVDAKSGIKVWNTKIDKVFNGENGSFDGPISTPLIYQDQVFAFSPYGKLHAINLADGEINWTFNVLDHQYKQPMYGFSTSPIAVAGTIVVQVGGRKDATVGLDPANGKIRWSTGAQLINSQIPAVMKFGDREVVLAFGGKGRGISELEGIDPKSGKSLFKHTVKCGNGSAVMPAVSDNNLVVLTVDDQYSKAVKIEKKGDKFLVTDAWKNKSIKNTYNVPAVCDEFVYSFSTRFLTCVDPEDGEALWKDRNPGDGFLISVDDHLVVSTKRGGIFVAAPSEEEFTPIAESKVFDDLVWSIPSYSDNAIFQRSLKELVRIDIVAADNVVAKKANDGRKVGTSFGKLLKAVASTDSVVKQKELVSEFAESRKSFPVIEDSIVHFLLQSSDKTGKSDVALACDAFGARQERKMIRIGATNWFYYPMELPADQRMNYVFIDSYEMKVDPKNSRKITSTLYAGEMEFAVRLRGVAPLEMSWFAMPEWVEPSFLKATSGAKGKIEAFQYKEWTEGQKGPGGRPVPKPEVQVYLPAGYESGKTEYPTIYLFDYPNAKEKGNLENTCNNLFSKGKKAIVVGLPMGMPGPEVAKVLVPAIEKKYRVLKDAKNRSTVGFGFASDAAMVTALGHPATFGSVSIQSSLAFEGPRKQILKSLKELNSPVRIQILWGNFDMNNPVENWDIRKISSSLFQAAKESPMAKVEGGQVHDTTDWSSWRNRWDKVFEFVLRN